MSIPRSYQDSSDLVRMRALLQTGLNIHADAYTIHPGELDLTLFNWLEGSNPWQNIYLWEAPSSRESLLGWGLLSTPWSGFDVFVQPDLWGSDWVCEVNSWMEDRSHENARSRKHSQVWRMNVAETDRRLRGHLHERGFQEVPEYTYLSMLCNLDEDMPETPIAEGFTLRQLLETDIADRARTQHVTFHVDRSVEEYHQVYQQFMASPCYSQAGDWVVIAPGGGVASFCTVWPDEVSRIGQVEPLGTHPDYRKKGLGKVILGAGLRYLHSAGMHSARVCVRADNLPAITLYERLGFQPTVRLLTFKKAL